MHGSHANHETAYSGDPNSHTSPVITRDRTLDPTVGVRERLLPAAVGLEDGLLALQVALGLPARRIRKLLASVAWKRSQSPALNASSSRRARVRLAELWVCPI
jgi:hypothetical protein